ncbi:MAG: isoaspartyl peptidase/L-asparaginase, partial [Burkholderiales bacterium]
MPSRRNFLASALFGSASLALAPRSLSQEKAPGIKPPQLNPPSHPVLVTKTTGLHSLDAAYKILQGGGDTLDAATIVCKAQEDDPNDTSVGLGGLPNEDGVVELDCSCMHGPTRRAGAVGAVKNIKNVSLLARAVMDHTGHVMLVGDEAEAFAVKMGFTRENLLTERSRKIWLLWKETMSREGWWGPGLSDPNWKAPAAPSHSELIERMQEVASRLGIAPQDRDLSIDHVLHRSHGTIHCSAVNTRGEMSGMTTTSGLEWKIAGRVGDSPIIGAGCFTDQDVGSVGATGSGEQNIRVAGAHTIVENMRRGMS